MAAVALAVPWLGGRPARGADPLPITMGFAAVDANTGAPISRAAAGSGFMYRAQLGCLVAGGCGAGTLTVTLPGDIVLDGAVNEPPGQGVSVTVSGPTITVTWGGIMEGNTTVLIPAEVPAWTNHTANAGTRTATAVLAADGLGAYAPTRLEQTAALELNVPPVVDVTLQGVAWTPDTMVAGSGALATFGATAVVESNAAASLTWSLPLRLNDGLFQGFDLTQVWFSSNRGGAVVTFTLPDGSSRRCDLAAGAVSCAVPAPGAVTAIDVQMDGLPAVEVDAGGHPTNVVDRTVRLVINGRLRDYRQDDPSQPIPPASSSQALLEGGVQVSASISGAGVATPVRQAQASAAVRRPPGSLATSNTWRTASGNDASVYGSGETSVNIIAAANTGDNLRRLAFSYPAEVNPSLFDYWDLVGAPVVVFPLGATRALVIYGCLIGGQTVNCGTDLLTSSGVATPPANMEQVWTIAVEFAGSMGPSSCDPKLTDLTTCTEAGSIGIPLMLRDTNRSTGATLGGLAPTMVGSAGWVAGLSEAGDVGSIVEVTTNQAVVRLIPPDLRLDMDKDMGDGHNLVTDPVTGDKEAGDYWLPGASANYRQHALDFDVMMVGHPGGDPTGLRGFTLTDPRVPPTDVAALAGTPFDYIKLTSLPTWAACEDASGGRPTIWGIRVWLYDGSTITEQAWAPGLDLDQVVGFAVHAATEEGRPLGASAVCDVGGAEVAFRDHLLSDPATEVTPSLGVPASSVLLAVGNAAMVVADGPSPLAAESSDELFLVDGRAAGLAKDFAPGASRFGLEKTAAVTAFTIAGVAADQGARAIRVTDGGPRRDPAQPDSWEVFSFTGAARISLGPDQALEVELLDAAGAVISTGTVATGNEGLTDRQVEDPSDPAWNAVTAVQRAIGQWTPALNTVNLDGVATVRATLRRASDPAKALQLGARFSVELAATLRSQVRGGGGAIGGSPTGVTYRNWASGEVSADGSTWQPMQTSDGAGLPPIAAIYTVYKAEQVFAGASTTWTSPGTLVAHDGGINVMTVTAANQTALGVPGEPDPAKKWLARDSRVEVGLDKLSLAVGSGVFNNPFAVVDFAGLEAIECPFAANPAIPEPYAPGSGAQRLAGVIGYQFADGSKAAFDVTCREASLEALAPDPALWPQVVSVELSWISPTSPGQVGLANPDRPQQVRLAFRTKLRQTVRQGYSIHAETPQGGLDILKSGEVIDGSYSVTSTPQVAADRFDASIPEVHPTVAPAKLFIAAQAYGVAATTEATPDSGLQRDQFPAVTWRFTATNAGNTGVDRLMLTTDAALLGRPADWTPPRDPAAYGGLAPGGIFDCFDLTGLRLRSSRGQGATGPVPGLTAVVAWRLDDGTWQTVSQALAANGHEATVGIDPAVAARVTGLRVELTSQAGRVEAGLGLTLTAETAQRVWLRSDGQVRAPGDTLDVAQPWQVGGMMAAAAVQGAKAAQWVASQETQVRAVYAQGVALPQLDLFVKRYDAAGDTGDRMAFASPGDTVPFYLVIRNEPAATANLALLRLVDRLPPELVYDETAGTAGQWSVVRQPPVPPGTRWTDPALELPSDLPGSSPDLAWQWGADPPQIAPGERLVIRLPLRLADGVAAGARISNLVELVAPAAGGGRSRCAPSAAQPDAACMAGGNVLVTVLQATGVRAVKRVTVADRAGPATQAWETVPGACAAPPAWDGTWASGRCAIATEPGSRLTYQLVLYNSGNQPLDQLRWADELPMPGRTGTVMAREAASAWGVEYVAGSLRLVTGVGGRDDPVVSFRYSPAENACSILDATAGANTLTCQGFAAAQAAPSRAIGGTVGFPPGQPLAGGEFVVLEWEAKVPLRHPSLGDGPGDWSLAWNSAAVTGSEVGGLFWLGAMESTVAGAHVTVEPPPSTPPPTSAPPSGSPPPTEPSDRPSLPSRTPTGSGGATAPSQPANRTLPPGTPSSPAPGAGLGVTGTPVANGVLLALGLVALGGALVARRQRRRVL
ncbi:MAG: hypothetical protein LBR19_08265 [Bifidobacteriaceae bacterium]|nr:hypothetical protein [Bifidobacteriaceae bacterium]